MIANVIGFLEKQDWIYSHGKKEGIFLLSFVGTNGTYHCSLDIDEELKRFVFVSYLGNNCPRDKMRDMAELLTKINSNLAYGNFEMNYPNGEIKLRTGTFFEDTELTEKAISNVVFRNVFAMDASSVFLNKFMFGSISSIDEVFEEVFSPKALPQTEDIPEDNERQNE